MKFTKHPFNTVLKLPSNESRYNMLSCYKQGLNQCKQNHQQSGEINV